MTLYHYADQNAFMSIIQTKELWATKIQYLNDENEYRLALNLAENYLTELKHAANPGWETQNIQDLIESIGYINDTNICVCSLSEQGDLLSQWRGYSNTLGGYSIGFNFEKLMAIAERQGFQLIKCVYDPETQMQLVRDAIDSAISEGSDYQSFTDIEYDGISKTNALFRKKMAQIAPIIKDLSFCEENEWRLFSTRSFEELSFRAGRSMLTPFFKFSLGDDTKSLIDEIIVGHTPHANLAIKSTEAFLTKNHPPEDGDYTCAFKVRSSSIPFRNW
ncbi:TPA: DUF2971 domain-containing protein [Vibrio vulnificus]